ncbi:MAG: P-II family nitrogen regulator [Saprospiraceae bacterium]|nr:P-II family nitrogen regulator [Saprospiraceae bacterium]
MKKIEAIIRKSKYDEVKEALHAKGVDFFTYWDVSGIGNEESGLTYRGIKYSTYDIARRVLSIVVEDSKVDSVVETLLSSARTGEVGDGKIFISNIEKAYRVRNSDVDGGALS